MRIESNHGEPHALRHLIYGLHPFIGWLKEQGIDYEPHLRQAEIPTDALSQPEFSITPTQELRFYQSVIHSLNQPQLGLKIGPLYHLSSYGMLGLAAMTSINLKQCYEVILDNILLTWTYFKVSVYDEGDWAFVQMDPVRDLGETVQFMIERDLSAAYRIALEALGQHLPLHQVEFKHAKPTSTEAYEEIFRCPAKFSAPFNRFAFDKQWINSPLQQSDPETSRVFSGQCQKISQMLSSQYSFTELVRYHLMNFRDRAPTLDSIASILNATPRTIQRRLAKEGKSFQELLDDVRISVSTEYLTTTKLTIEEIAARVGYSDAAAFSNAFKRWKGVSPLAYRKSH
ncbi:AraC family transcriptional regulator [Pseudomaricurvus alkylphenolicus]|uniref:AraC family transcriptional regulator n=1 Tax=Pseudomaricurvus alkylphenolicus TaxID=1306991 RepID=UPI001420246D|nr:AraC family transcriptional regulator [Pseudomaricurvus alkylphenolicus]NIB41603.1 AraC family transcriptional regulator [Pseudomaricurvus alkylphenolicus]